MSCFSSFSCRLLIDRFYLLDYDLLEGGGSFSLSRYLLVIACIYFEAFECSLCCGADVSEVSVIVLVSESSKAAFNLSKSSSSIVGL